MGRTDRKSDYGSSGQREGQTFYTRRERRSKLPGSKLEKLNYVLAMLYIRLCMKLSRLVIGRVAWRDGKRSRES